MSIEFFCRKKSMISAIPNPMWLLIRTKFVNLSNCPDHKMYFKVSHNWHVCVISRVELTDVEKYWDFCTSFTIIFITLLAINYDNVNHFITNTMWQIWCASMPFISLFFYMSWEEWITLGQKLNYIQKVSIMAWPNNFVIST